MYSKCIWSTYLLGSHNSKITVMVTRYFRNCFQSIKCSSQVKESAYLMMIRHQLEYASDVWDPHHVGDIMELESTTKSSPLDACWMIMVDLVQLLDQSSWPTLQTRHKISRLHSYIAVFYHQLSLTIPLYSYYTYQQHDQRYSIIHYTTSYLIYLVWHTKIAILQEW